MSTFLLKRNLFKKYIELLLKNNKEKANFISDFIKVMENIDMSHIPDNESFESIIQEYTRFSESIQYKYSCCIKITKYSKAW